MQLGRVHHDPGDDCDGLADDVLRSAEEPCGLLGHPPECVVAEGAVQLCATMFELGRGLAWFRVDTLASMFLLSGSLPSHQPGHISGSTPGAKRSLGPVFRNDPGQLLGGGPGYFFAFLACRFSFSVF
jgi:hypothetical protein